MSIFSKQLDLDSLYGYLNNSSPDWETILKLSGISLLALSLIYAG